MHGSTKLLSNLAAVLAPSDDCVCPPRRRRYFTCALKHAQELAEQVKITSKRDKAGTVEMQEQVGIELVGVTTTCRLIQQAGIEFVQSVVGCCLHMEFCCKRVVMHALVCTPPNMLPCRLR